MNYVVILAGGVGKRSGEPIPKQFLKTNGKPLLVYTLEKFENSKFIDGICVVTLNSYVDVIKSYKEEYNITKLKKIVTGGISGIASALNGFNALLNENISDSDIVLFHDGVRPFITSDIIEDNVRVATLYGNAMASVECVETLVKCSEDGSSNRMIERDQLYRVQTPQSFRADILKQLFSDIVVEKVREPSIFAYYINKGGIIHCSKGSERNIKITYPQDVEYFREFFN